MTAHCTCGKLTSTDYFRHADNCPFWQQQAAIVRALANSIKKTQKPGLNITAEELTEASNRGSSSNDIRSLSDAEIEVDSLRLERDKIAANEQRFRTQYFDMLVERDILKAKLHLANKKIEGQRASINGMRHKRQESENRTIIRLRAEVNVLKATDAYRTHADIEKQLRAGSHSDRNLQPLYEGQKKAIAHLQKEKEELRATIQGAIDAIDDWKVPMLNPDRKDDSEAIMRLLATDLCKALQFQGSND